MARATPDLGFGTSRVGHVFGDWDLGGWARGGARPAPLLVFRPERRFVTKDGVALPVDLRFANEAGVGLEAARAAGTGSSGELGRLSRDPELGDAWAVTLGIERRAIGGP